MSEFEEFCLDAFITEKSQSTKDTPHWLSGYPDSAKEIFSKVLERRDEIKENLQNGINLTGKAKKVIKAEMAKAVDKNSAYLNSRDFPDLCRFIDDTNDQLARIKVVGQKPVPKSSVSAAELSAEVKRLESMLLSNQLQALIDSGLLDQLSKVKRQQIEVQIENKSLSEKLVKAKVDHQKVVEHVSELLEEITLLKLMVRELGGDPERILSMRIVK